MDRFWSKVQKTPTHWIWTAGKTKQGYGVFYLNGRMQMAHRVAWELVKGPIPPGKEIDHVCRRVDCVRPHRKHLEPVTHQQNIKRGKFPNSAKTHCSKGHEFTKENTRIRPDGGRQCIACNRKYSREGQRKRRAKLK